MIYIGAYKWVLQLTHSRKLTHKDDLLGAKGASLNKENGMKNFLNNL